MSTTPVSHPPRIRVQSDTVLGTAHILAQLVKDVTDIAKVPFASEAASLVLSLLEIAKGVKDNNDARVRLVTTAATYLIKLGPILNNQDSSEDIPPELRHQLEDFQHALVELKNDLEIMKKQNLWKRVFGKDRISTTLQDRKDALQASYNALQMWTNVNTYALVRKSAKEPDADGILRFDQSQVVLKATIKANRDSGFFSNFQTAELLTNGCCRPVLVKRFANKTERDDEAKKWRKLWHANLPQLAGCSNDRSTMQFILFHDTYLTFQTAEIRSLAAFVLDFSRTHDVFSLINKLTDFINDAISAIRHMQVMLNYDEDETARLARITKFTIRDDGRIVVTPPLLALTKSGGGVRSRIYSSLFPVNGSSEASMRRYFAELDDMPTHATLTEVLDSEQLEKWAVLNSVRAQLRRTPDGFQKPEQYVMPETRRAWADYSVDIEPGDFGVLVSGERKDYAFRRVVNSAANNSALFEYQSWHWMKDRDNVSFEVVCKQPKTWRLERLTDRCLFYHRHKQKLTHTVYRSRRSLELSAPKDCDVDELVFVVSVWRYRSYQYALRSESLGESQVADIYASLPNWNSDEILFSHCAPGLCSDSCDHPLDSRVSIERYGHYMRIEYVSLPVAKRTADLEKSHRLWAPRSKEYESIVPRRNETEKRSPAEWP